jgi:hypothetical protein
MLKKLALISAVSAFAMGTALAQSPNPSATTTSPSVTEAPKSDMTAPKSDMTAPKNDMTAPKAETTVPKGGTTASTSSTGGAQFVASQKPDQFLSSKFKGTDVVGADNQKVGDVSDILFDKQGKIEAFVVSVGGFLGIGAKDVALAPSAFQFMPGDPNSATDRSPKLKISMDKEQLTQAANFEPYKEPRATTGTGNSGGAPRPGGMSK